MTEERKFEILFAATILAARRLAVKKVLMVSAAPTLVV